LLRNSLSRTREYIADAYATFHGFDEPLKNALYKYAAVESLRKSWNSSLHFFTNPKWKQKWSSWVNAHPSLQDRLQTIDKKEYLREYQKNLSPQLAYWTGLVSAFLYYNTLVSITGFSILIQVVYPFSDEIIGTVFTITGFYLIMSIIGISYIFPSTKGIVSFSDFKRKSFIIPFLRNWGITVITGCSILVILFFNIVPLQIYIYATIIGFFIWLIGFTASLPSYGIRDSYYLLFSPLFTVLILWYPVTALYKFIYNSGVDINYCISSMAGIILVSLLLLFIFLEKGYLNIDNELQVLKFFNKKFEISWNKWIFSALSIIVLCSIPTFLAFAVYALSCYMDSFNLFYDMGIFLIIIPPLILYAFMKINILFLTEILFYIDIFFDIIPKKDTDFIENVLHAYQSPDGGFDCAGLHFSNQRDTYLCIKAATQLQTPIDEEKARRWIYSTWKERGFSMIPEGNPRIESTFYAIRSVILLNNNEKIPEDRSSWLLQIYNGSFFACENDTCSSLLQTCYALESLSLLDALPENLDCSVWINHWLSQNIDPQEAYFAVRSLKILHSSLHLGHRWLERNKRILETRIDKNTEDIYYYVMVLQELEGKVPYLVKEEAIRNISKKREKYGNKFRNLSQ
jgi:hypothetical protein